jgi:hypothetical protein
MTWSVDSSGTDTAVVGTEQTLDTSTSNGTFVFVVDTTNMALGDVTELRIYTKTLNTSGLDQVWKATYGPNPSFNPVAMSPPVASDQSIKVTLKQVAGTARTYDWKVLRI